MLDARTYPSLTVQTPAPVPIEAMLIGQPVEEAAALLPRIFNLCREAQSVAARAAFGLPLDPMWRDRLRADILRAHVVKLAIQWPALLGCPPVMLPRDWQTAPDALRHTLFGPAAQAPQTPAAFARFLAAQDGVAPVLCALSELFAPGWACRAPLPTVTEPSMFASHAQENSVAARHADHPLLRAIERHWGRGPLWDATALCLEIDALSRGALPEAHLEGDTICVPAARGIYGVQARVAGGCVMAFRRVTPTDHMCAPEGVLDQCVRSLPAAEAQALSPILLAVLDPCVPVQLVPQEARHA